MKENIQRTALRMDLLRAAHGVLGSLMNFKTEDTHAALFSSGFA